MTATLSTQAPDQYRRYALLAVHYTNWVAQARREGASAETLAGLRAQREFWRGRTEAAHQSLSRTIDRAIAETEVIAVNRSGDTSVSVEALACLPIS